MALSRTRRQREVGGGGERSGGEGEETAETEMTIRHVSQGEGRWKKGRWILQPSVKTQKITIQCSSSFLSGGLGGGFLSFSANG